MLYKIEIPSCPTKEEVKQSIQRLNGGEFIDLKYDMINSLDLLESWPEVYGTWTTGSAFCNLPKYGKQKVTINKIITIKL